MQDVAWRDRRRIDPAVTAAGSLLLEFKQIFERLRRAIDAQHNDIRDQAYSSYNSGCITDSDIGSTGTLNSLSAIVDLL